MSADDGIYIAKLLRQGKIVWGVTVLQNVENLLDGPDPFELAANRTLAYHNAVGYESFEEVLDAAHYTASEMEYETEYGIQTINDKEPWVMLDYSAALDIVDRQQEAYRERSRQQSELISAQEEGYRQQAQSIQENTRQRALPSLLPQEDVYEVVTMTFWVMADHTRERFVDTEYLTLLDMIDRIRSLPNFPRDITFAYKDEVINWYCIYARQAIRPHEEFLNINIRYEGKRSIGEALPAPVPFVLADITSVDI